VVSSQKVGLQQPACKYRVAHKNVPDFANGACISWRKISFCVFVDQYVLLLTYKFQ